MSTYEPYPRTRQRILAILSSVTLSFVIGGLLLWAIALPPPTQAAALFGNTITVTSNADSGAGTLRQAIAQTNPGDTIIFADSLSGLTITLASTLEIAQNLTIDGSALPISITLSGNNAARIMRVGNNARVTLDSLILTRGRQNTPDCFWDEGDFACGGGLKVETGAVVTLTRSAVLDNWAQVIGGGVANYGEMRITDTTFVGNVSIRGGAILNLGVLQAVHSAFITNNATSGGAILNEGVLTVTQSVFTGNSADLGLGGAIASTGGALTVTQSVFTGNSADRGGAIVHTEGELSSGPVVIAFSAFTSNTAENSGGAIVIHDGGRHSPRIIGQIADSTFSGNRVLNAVPTLSSDGSGGGAIYASANLNILRSAFHGNVSSARGGALFSQEYHPSRGGLLTVTQSVFTDNQAGQWGGAASLGGGALVQNCLFVGNQVTQTKAIPGSTTVFQGYGGGIYIDTSSSQSAQINNSTLSGNGAARQGGGLFVNKGTVHLTHVTVADNGAPEGAGIYVGSQLGRTGVGTLYYTNTLVARNLLGNSGLRGADCVVKPDSALGTNVNNLVEDGSCSADGVGFLSGDPLLSPLTDLGGQRVGVNQDVPLRIYGLRPGSPALDSAASSALTTDQRGFARPQAAASDRGAYEHGPLRLALTVAPAATMPLGGLVTYTLVLNNAAAVPDPDVRLTVTLPAGLTFEQWGEIPPDGTMSTSNGLHWQGSMPAASSLEWVFETRNTGAVNQPGEYGDELLTTAYVSGDTDPGNWTDLTVIVECDPDPLSVDNSHNAGPCSLRQTLADAPPGATITFHPELAGQTIWVVYPKPFSELPPRNATLVIDRDVTVDGNSLLTPIILDGNDESRLLLITNAANVTVNHLTLTHGRASTEELPNVCGIGVAGGAIKIVTGAALTLTRSSVINNTAMDSSGTLWNGGGGGIANLGRLTVLSSTIANNYAAGTYAGGGLINGAVSSGAPMAVAIIADSVITGNLAPRPDFAMGGGVMNCYRGTLTVTRSLIAGNQVSGGMGGGAGLANYEGTVVVSESAFVNNTTVNPPLASNYGGGILTSNSAIIQNSAFSGNQAGRGGAITAYDSLTLTHSTLAGNVATASEGAGGLDMRGDLDGMFYLQNNLIANNTTGGGGAQCALNRDGIVGRNVNNLVRDGTCSINGVGFLSGDPLIGAWGDNGGPRIGPNADVPLLTYALLPTSQAIDAGDLAACPSTDQRGFPRTDLGCDIGAFEMQYADSDTVARPVAANTLTTFGPALAGVQRDGGVADPGVITVTKRIGWATQGPESIGAWWEITPTVAEGFSLTLQLCYSAAELGALSADDLRFWRLRDGSWAQVGGAPTLTTVNGHDCATISGVDGLSVWTLATGMPTAVSLSSFSAASQVGWAGLLVGVMGVVWATAVLRRRRR